MRRHAPAMLINSRNRIYSAKWTVQYYYRSIIQRQEKTTTLISLSLSLYIIYYIIINRLCATQNILCFIYILNIYIACSTFFFWDSLTNQILKKNLNVLTYGLNCLKKILFITQDFYLFLLRFIQVSFYEIILLVYQNAFFLKRWCIIIYIFI